MQEIADILKISKSIRLLAKMKNVPFILRKKTIQTCGPNRQEQLQSHWKEREAGEGQSPIYACRRHWHGGSILPPLGVVEPMVAIEYFGPATDQSLS